MVEHILSLHCSCCYWPKEIKLVFSIDSFSGEDLKGLKEKSSVTHWEVVNGGFSRVRSELPGRKRPFIVNLQDLAHAGWWLCSVTHVAPSVWNFRHTSGTWCVCARVCHCGRWRWCLEIIRRAPIGRADDADQVRANGWALGRKQQHVWMIPTNLLRC